MTNLNSPFESKKVGTSNLEIKNSFIKSATFEGLCPDGEPSQRLIDHHARLAKGGVGLTTVSYGAVSENGRTFKDQLYIREDQSDVYRKLSSAVHKAGGKISMQLTHCGYFSKNRKGRPILAPSRVFNAYGLLAGLPFSKEMTEENMVQVKEDFCRSALLLKKCGFDAVEIHMGHGYLLSQFLSPLTNKRKDSFGGSIENRSKFPLLVVKEVASRLGKDFPVIVKLNLSDGVDGGFSIDDSIYVAKGLEKIGCSAIVLSGGFTSKSPFYMMRGAIPLKGMIKYADSLAEKLTFMLFGKAIIKEFSFTPNFFLNQALQIKKQVNIDLAYLGGVESIDDINQILKLGFKFIALARPLIHDPDFIDNLENGSVSKTACNRCNECIVEMNKNHGVRCVLND